MSHANFEHLGDRARIACRLLLIGLLMDAGALGLEVMTTALNIDTNAEVPTTQAMGFILALAGVGISQFVLLVATAVFFLRWMHLASTNVHKLQITGLKFTPKMTMWYWFIPIVNLFRPYQAMKETWQASDPNSTDENWKSIKPPLVMGTWWTLWVVQGILGQIAMKLVMKGGTGTDGLVDLLSAGSDLFSICAAFCLIRIVNTVTFNQDRKFATGSVAEA